MKLFDLNLLINFLHSGGWVLEILMGVCWILTTLILERYWFRCNVYPSFKKQLLAQIEGSPHGPVWLSEYCKLDLQVQQFLPLMRVLISLCPLIGLLGTVTGMIQVFDGLAMNQGSNPQVMAGGIAKATLPTMAGMAIAVFGLIFYTHLHRWCSKERQALGHQTGADDYL